MTVMTTKHDIENITTEMDDEGPVGPLNPYVTWNARTRTLQLGGVGTMNANWTIEGDWDGDAIKGNGDGDMIRIGEGEGNMIMGKGYGQQLWLGGKGNMIRSGEGRQEATGSGPHNMVRY